VLAKRARQLRVSRHTRRDTHLQQRLHLDRMSVRQVLRQLFFERLRHTGLLPSKLPLSRAAATRVSAPRVTYAAPYPHARTIRGNASR
jgi:hypothetical protein